ncbi:MAG: hypothetical protein ACFCVK_09050 [Acidimicrobiales bacterium]
MSATPQAEPVDGHALPTHARGARPTYFDDGGTTDALVSIITALSAEVWALRERLDSLETLLDAAGTVARDQVEAHRPDTADAARRAGEAAAYTGRVFRVFYEMREELRAGQTTDDYLDLVRRAFAEI